MRLDFDRRGFINEQASNLGREVQEPDFRFGAKVAAAGA